jgi:hypothetical protein
MTSTPGYISAEHPEGVPEDHPDAQAGRGDHDDDAEDANVAGTDVSDHCGQAGSRPKLVFGIQVKKLS